MSHHLHEVPPDLEAQIERYVRSRPPGFMLLEVWGHLRDSGVPAEAADAAVHAWWAAHADEYEDYEPAGARS